MRGAATPLTRIRFRAPPAAAAEPGRRASTSISSPAATGPRRGPLGAPADQLDVGRRAVRAPRARTTIASSRLVLPAAFGPQTAAAPPRSPPRGSRSPAGRVSSSRFEQSFGTPGAARPDRINSRVSDVVRTGMTTWTYWSSPIGLKTPGASGPVELERELLRGHVLEDVGEVPRVERDRRPVALDRRLDLAHVVADLRVGAHRDPRFAVRGDLELHDVGGRAGR